MVTDQVITQYNTLKSLPVGAGFFAAFLAPMTISAGAQIAFHIPSDVLSINAEVRISTDGKILITGDVNLFNGLQRLPARIYGDLSKIAKGQATLLIMAQDIYTGNDPLTLMIPTSAEFPQWSIGLALPGHRWGEP